MAKIESLDKKDKISIMLFLLVSIILVVLIWRGFFSERESVISPAEVAQEIENDGNQRSVSEFFEAGQDSDSFVLTDEDPFLEDCREHGVDQGVTVSSNTVCLR